jgi:tRNA(Arg) A34 adenosine deaminase TadA
MSAAEKMQMTLELARIAMDAGECPIAAVVFPVLDSFIKRVFSFRLKHL